MILSGALTLQTIRLQMAFAHGARSVENCQSILLISPVSLTLDQFIDLYKERISLQADLKFLALSEYIVFGVPLRPTKDLKAAMNSSVP
jgi:hypothetical protein